MWRDGPVAATAMAFHFLWKYVTVRLTDCKFHPGTCFQGEFFFSAAAAPTSLTVFFFLFVVPLINSCRTSWIGQAWQTSPWPFLRGKLSGDDTTPGCQKAIIQKHKSATHKLIRKHSESVGALAEAAASSSTCGGFNDQKCLSVFTRRSDCESNVHQSPYEIVAGQISYRLITVAMELIFSETVVIKTHRPTEWRTKPTLAPLAQIKNSASKLIDRNTSIHNSQDVALD